MLGITMFIAASLFNLFIAFYSAFKGFLSLFLGALIKIVLVVA
jgi:hypothetical protein